jgi:hypothetical protein
MMNARFFRFIFLPLVFSAALTSCSARIEGALGEDGSAELSLEASLEPQMAALIRSLSALFDPAGSGGAAGEPPLIDGPAIARSVAAAPGVAAVSLRNRGSRTILGDIRLSRVDDFLKVPGTEGEGRFISYEAAPSGGGRLLLRLDRQNAPEMLALLSEEVSAYLTALLAPAATGEALSQAEYLDLVASIYGRPLADEIAAARITAALDFPRPITAIRGGTSQGNRASFDLPLLDLLVLESPLSYAISWE